jgi:hypothetical protein
VESIMRTALFVLYEAYNFDVFLSVAQYFRNMGHFNVVLHSPYFLPRTDEYRRRCGEAGIPYVHETTALGGAIDVLAQVPAIRAGFRATPGPRPTASIIKSASPPQPIPRVVPLQRQQVEACAGAFQGLSSSGRQPSEAVRGTNEQFPQRLLAALEFYRQRFELIRKLLAQLDVAVVILPEHVVERDSGVWLEAAHERGVPVLVVSSSWPDRSEAARTYCKVEDYGPEPMWNQFLLHAHPHWGLEWQGRTLVRLPAPQAFAQEWYGIAPPSPWLINSGPLDAVVVESEFHRDLYGNLGLQRERLVVAGSPAFDQLTRVAREAPMRRAALLSKWNLAGNRLVLLCALPPDQFADKPAPEFTSYREMTAFWVQALTDQDRFHVVISPHPTIPEAVLSELERLGARVVRGGVAQLLPLCDVFVASVSSTIKWARACGKPVVNYDAYRYEYGDFESMESVYTVLTRADFRALLARLNNDEDYRQQTMEKACLDMTYYGRMDGQFLPRLHELVLSRVQQAEQQRLAG